ncbi:MAG: TIGR03936 family radical SAM-associated protein [bacterium]|jgi:radical SAM-linked protein
MKIRIKLAKGQAVRFISHLDLVGAVEKAVRRAKLPVALSEGFTPRLKISFASALALGSTSEGEYADFELSEYVPAAEFRRRLNEQLPPAIEVLAAQPVASSSPALMSQVVAALYRVEGEMATSDQALAMNKWDKFLLQPEIIITKMTKKRTSQVNIKPLIIKAEFYPTGSVCHWRLLLSSGQQGNLRPEQLLQAFFDFADVAGEVKHIHRINLFVERFGQLVSPLARVRLPVEAGEVQ